MKKHGFRSIFSLLLAIMMVCSMLPTAAFAEGDAEGQSVVVEPVGTPAGELKQDEVKQPEGETPEEPKQPEGETPEEPKQPEGETPEEPKQDEVKPPEGETSQGPAKPADPAPSDTGVPGGNLLTVSSIPDPDPTPAALNTGHKIDVTFTVLYVGDEFKIGYNYGSSEKTKFVCQYTSNHSDTAYNNHTIAISDIKAAAGRASVNSGYQIVGWSKESNANPTTWPLNKSGTTACNKGNTIYLVAKNPNPTTKYTYVLKYDANGGTGAPGDDSWDTTDASIPYHSFTVTSTVPTRAGYTFKGWKGKANDGSDEIYTGGMTCAVSQYGNDVVENGNTWTRTLYAVWEENRPSAAWNEISKVLGTQVYVQCVSDTENHAKRGYELRCETSAVGRVRGGYACNVYVYAKGKPGLTSYVDEYNTTYPNTNHVLDNSDTGRRGFELRYDDGGDGWYIYKGDSVPIVFNVKCEEQQPQPDKPGAPDEETVMGALKGAVKITCTTPNSGHNPKVYDLMSGFTPGTVQGDASTGYTYTISVNAGSYVYRYSGAAPDGIGAAHELATDEQQNKQITLHWNGTAWVAETALPINFNVKCEEQQPEGPSEITDGDLEALLKGALKIECTEVEGHVKLYDVKKEDVRRKNVSGFNAEITFDATPYFGEFIGEFGQHSSVAGESLTKVITLKWVDGKWVATNTPIIHKVVCVP